jgi:peptidoglycan/xylan/chitin deacetylase (PgdA/CDA1 family)
MVRFERGVVASGVFSSRQSNSSTRRVYAVRNSAWAAWTLRRSTPPSPRFWSTIAYEQLMSGLFHRLGRRLLSRKPSILVLMYHRIAEVQLDPWNLCVSPTHFEQQLQWMKKHARVLSVEQLSQQLNAGQLEDGGLVLTFDDGYADNYTTARPLLETYGLPATFFLTTGPLEQPAMYWWDALQQILFETLHLPALLALQVGPQEIRFALETETYLSAPLRASLQAWKATDPPPSKRAQLYMQLWQQLRSLPAPQQQSILGSLRDWANSIVAHPADPVVLSLAQLTDLAHHPLIDVGVHTVTHPALGEHNRAVQLAEIVHSKRRLESWCKRPLSAFAYP